VSIIGVMARRSPARLLAPLALVGFVIALLVVINGASPGGSSDKTGAKPAASASATPTRKQKARRARRRYVVKAGDTPSGIAQKTGVPLSQILQLNPDLDDQSLSVGDKIKLRK
jgi:LysM repeat protein